MSINKPVGELARPLPSFKQPLLSIDVMVGMCDSIESNFITVSKPWSERLVRAKTGTVTR